MQKKIIIIGALVSIFSLLSLTDAIQYFSIDRLQQWFADEPLKTALIYFVFYVIITAVSFPGAAVVTLLGGAVFGLWWGALLVSFASSIGATFAFLVSRNLFSDWVNNKFGNYLETIHKGIEREGAFYLFSLRLIPFIPFFVINLVFGLSRMKTITFYWVSQVGMLAGTFVYVNAGHELGAIDSLDDILTPKLIIAFLLLACFPHIARKAVPFIAYIANTVKYAQIHRKALKPYSKPKKFDTNVVVIGAGSAGLVSAYIAAAVKAKVTLIEKHKMGGDCLNTGCVPSKALIRSAKINHYIQHADQLGIDNASGEVNFPKVMQRIHKVIATVEPHDSVERYTKLGVDCEQGEASILSPYEVQVGKRTITTKNIIIATGARPFIPPIPGLADIDYLTSDNLWSITEQPKKLLVIGAGPIGCELAQAFQRLGTQVTLVGRASRIMPREDSDVSNHMLASFKKEGIHVFLGQQVVAFKTTAKSGVSSSVAVLENDNNKSQQQIPFDKVLVAVGRRANTDHLNLEKLGIEIADNGTVVTDEFLRTKFANILACGDVAGPYQFTHTAAHQAWYASVNALFGVLKKFQVDYSVIPWATFTDPEVAHVGLNEENAKQQGIEYEVTRYGIDDLDRAIADNEAKGFVKVLTAKGSDRILGATIVGYHASELITEFITAMKHKIGLNKILGTIHIYPTLSEANKFAAGEWKRAHVSTKTLVWLEKFHQWRRGKKVS